MATITIGGKVYEPVTEEQRPILEALAAIPASQWTRCAYDNDLSRWESYVTSNDQNKLGMMVRTERELAGNVEFYLKVSLGLQAASFPDEARQRAVTLWVLARLAAVREYIHRFKFYAALVSPKFGKLTDGHRVSPDSYHVYAGDKSSPTGVCLEISGPKNAAYRALIAAAKRNVGTSNSFA